MGSSESLSGNAGYVRLVVNGQPCGAFIGASPCARGLLFVGADKSLILRKVALQLMPGELRVRGTVVGWGRRLRRR